MMKLSTILCACLSFVLLAGCASQPTMEKNFDQANDFSEYRTSALLPNPLFCSDQDLNPEVIETVNQSIRETLAAKGFSEAAERNAADFTVGYAVGATRYIEVRSLPVDYRGALGGPWSTIYYEDREIAVSEGALAIHIFDVDSRTAVFATRGSKRLSS